MKNHAFYKPNAVQIELVQGCNRHCSFCGVNGLEAKIHYISKPVLKRECELIAESGYKPRIILAGHGENVLHPHFINCVKLIRKINPDIEISLYTNGYSIKKDYNNILEMFEAGINDIHLDEYTDNKYDYDKLKAVTEKFPNAKFEIMGDKGVSFYSSRSATKYRLLVVPAIDEKQISSTRVLTNHCGAGLPPDTSCKDRTCAHIFRELIFRWDGWVNICCNDFRGQFAIVNCMDESVKCFDDMWRHDTFEAVRRVMYHKKRIFFPCNVCNAKSLRAGLIPDYKGQETMEEPTKEDIKLVQSIGKQPALSVIKKREWEE